MMMRIRINCIDEEQKSEVTTKTPEKLLGDEGSRSEGTKLIQIFIKAEENIDVSRTMIKEHDQQANTKATPRRLAYADSDKEAPAGSLARSFFDRFSLESFGNIRHIATNSSRRHKSRGTCQNKNLSYREGPKGWKAEQTKEKVKGPSRKGKRLGTKNKLGL
ncbi:hypothetical protein Tco_1466301 [Tanacetum coccineum]